MKSATLPSFWEKYNSLDSRVKEQARKAYRFWLENPFHRIFALQVHQPGRKYLVCENHARLSSSGDFTRRYRDMVLDWKPR